MFLSTLTFLKKTLSTKTGQKLEDSVLWDLKRLELKYRHETFGECRRSFFQGFKERTKKSGTDFYEFFYVGAKLEFLLLLYNYRRCHFDAMLCRGF